MVCWGGGQHRTTTLLELNRFGYNKPDRFLLDIPVPFTLASSIEYKLHLTYTYDEALLWCFLRIICMCAPTHRLPITGGGYWQ